MDPTNEPKIQSLIMTIRKLISETTSGCWEAVPRYKAGSLHIGFAIRGPATITGDESETLFTKGDAIYIVATRPEIMTQIMDAVDAYTRGLEEQVSHLQRELATGDVKQVTQEVVPTQGTEAQTQIIANQLALIKCLKDALFRADNLTLTTEARTAKDRARRLLEHMSR